MTIHPKVWGVFLNNVFIYFQHSTDYIQFASILIQCVPVTYNIPLNLPPPIKHTFTFPLDFEA